jgi:hypothetical protein
MIDRKWQVLAKNGMNKKRIVASHKIINLSLAVALRA